MSRFKVSQIVYVYNQRRYVDEVVAAAFAQDFAGEMEILLSDDGSTDGSYERLQELAQDYSGPGPVRVRQTPQNRGACYHVDQAVRESQGELIVGIAGDDIPLPHRVSTMVRRWEELGCGTALIYSDIDGIDESGNPVPTPGWVYSGEHSLPGMAAGFVEAIGASSAFTRDLIEKFPGFRPDLIHEDRVLAWRSLLLGGTVEYLDLKTIRYRIVGGISRRVPRDLKDYLRNWSRHKSDLILPDAHQRLLDLDHIGSKDDGLFQECRRTIADLEFRRELADAHWVRLEAVVLRYLRRGARAGPLLRHYVKLRLRWLIQRRSNRIMRRNAYLSDATKS